MPGVAVPSIIADYLFEGEIGPAHFLITEAGDVRQYANLQKSVDPRRSIVIAHAGASLTEAQFQATVRLHGHIRERIAVFYGSWFPLNRNHVLPFSELSPGRYPSDRFPWERLYGALSEWDEQTAADDALAALQSLKRRGLLT